MVHNAPPLVPPDHGQATAMLGGSLPDHTTQIQKLLQVLRAEPLSTFPQAIGTHLSPPATHAAFPYNFPLSAAAVAAVGGARCDDLSGPAVLSTTTGRTGGEQLSNGGSTKSTSARGSSDRTSTATPPGDGRSDKRRKLAPARNNQQQQLPLHPQHHTPLTGAAGTSPFSLTNRSLTRGAADDAHPTLPTTATATLAPEMQLWCDRWTADGANTHASAPASASAGRAGAGAGSATNTLGSAQPDGGVFERASAAEIELLAAKLTDGRTLTTANVTTACTDLAAMAGVPSYSSSTVLVRTIVLPTLLQLVHTASRAVLTACAVRSSRFWTEICAPPPVLQRYV
jgi:hypothetical protein